jgi:hypothetical protein
MRIIWIRKGILRRTIPSSAASKNPEVRRHLPDRYGSSSPDN